MSDNASSVGSPKTKPKNRLIASNRVKGTAVYRRDGQKVGTVHSFIVDKLTGQVGYARSEEHTSELQSLMRISYAVFFLKKKKTLNILINTRKQTSTYTQNNQTLIFTNIIL